MKLDPWEDRQERKLPLAKGLMILFFSTLTLLVAALLGFLYYQQVREGQKLDPNYTLTTLIHETSNERLLPEGYLEEFLELSKDQPINLYRFSLAEAEKRLAAHPCLREVSVELLPPDSLIVRYSMPEPVAFAGHLSNTVIDAKGKLFTYAPFYSDQQLPTLYFNEDPTLGLEILRGCSFQVKVVDTTQSDTSSYGHRQIVITTQEDQILRLASKNMNTQLERYQKLITTHPELSFQMMDLRLPNLAYTTG